MTHTEDEWSGCYGERWTEISPAAFSHPAKSSRDLIRKIYDHIVEEKWASEGSRIIDPFGGVALGGLEAMQRGMVWIGCELESRFVMLGQGAECDGHTCPDCSAEIPETEQSSMFATLERAPHRYHGNIERWEQKGFKGTARLLNGDSRRLVAVIREADLSLTSPPYGQRTVHGQPGIDLTKNPNDRTGAGSQIHTQDKYGDDPGQLGNLPMKDLELSISSPPYIDSVNQSDGANDSTARKKRKAKAGVDISKPVNVGGPNSVLNQNQNYGNDPAQLGAMKEGDHDLVIGSPPFGSSTHTEHRAENMTAGKARRGGDEAMRVKQDYAPLEDEGNLAHLEATEDGLSVAISSPPYINSVNAGDHGIDWSKVDQENPNNKGRKRGEDTPHGKRLRTQLAYTENPDPANLGAMDPGDFEAALDQPGEWVKMCERGWASQRFIKLPNPHDDNCPSCESPGSCVWERIPVGTPDVAISSPPYNLPMSQDHSGKRGGKRGHTPSEQGAFARYGNTEGQLEGMKSDQESFDSAIGSPPYPQPHLGGGGLNVEGYSKDWQKNDLRDLVGKRTYQGRGADREEGNLETMETGDFDATISSPPYSDQNITSRRNFLGGGGNEQPANVLNRNRDDGYGEAEGQLGTMPRGDYDATVTSPPWESTLESGGGIDVNKLYDGMVKKHGRSGTPEDRAKQVELMSRRVQGRSYGQDDNNLGKQRGEDFWSASRLILEQLYEILVPGAAAVFVVKRFVRRGSIVDFPAQWARLCEAVGFVWLHDHHALLTEEHGEQHTLEGEVEVKKTQFKSFFRRLHEKKSPETAIEWESVLCFVKPKE